MLKALSNITGCLTASRCTAKQFAPETAWLSVMLYEQCHVTLLSIVSDIRPCIWPLIHTEMWLSLWEWINKHQWYLGAKEVSAQGSRWVSHFLTLRPLQDDPYSLEFQPSGSRDQRSSCPSKKKSTLYTSLHREIEAQDFKDLLGLGHAGRK